MQRKINHYWKRKETSDETYPPPPNSFFKFGVKIVPGKPFTLQHAGNSTTGHCFESQISDSFQSRDKLVFAF